MDVVVVGAGITGMSVAWRLRQRGLRVSVWDQGAAGRESSYAGAGMLAPGGELETMNWWTGLALASLKRYPDFVRELQSESGVPIDYRACGALEFAAGGEEWQRLLARAARQREIGIPVEDAGENRLFYPEDAAVDPRHVLLALRAGCRLRGVVFHEGCAVNEVVASGDTVERPEPAGAAVIAAGAWSSNVSIIVDGERQRMEPAIPVRGHLISYAPGSETPGPILRHGHTYLVERSNGALIAGSTTEHAGFNRLADPLLYADVARRAEALLPRLTGARRSAEWIGFRPGTASEEPQLKRMRETPVFLAYGHYRNGILMAPGTATFLADAITSSLRTDLFLPGAHR